MASSPEISCSAVDDASCSICQYMDTYSLDMVCRFTVSVLGFTLYDKEAMTMKNSRCCRKCHSGNIIRVTDDAHRYLSNSICIT